MTSLGEKIKREEKNSTFMPLVHSQVFVLRAVVAKLHRGAGSWANGSLQSSLPQQAEMES